MAWNDIRRYGSGIGIEIRGEDLRVVAVRSRPSGVTVLGSTLLTGAASRPVAEWGAEYAAFAQSLGLGHVAACVCLPRREVVVRQIQLPPMGDKERAAAVRFQLDGLHPFGDDDVAFASAPLASGAEFTLIASAETITEYADRFGEAGVAVSAFTVAPAAVRAAVRSRWDDPPRPFLIAELRNDVLDVYGESEGRPLLSAEMNLRTASPGLALDRALADLRLEPEAQPLLVLAGDAPSGSGDDDEPRPADWAGRELTPAAELLPVPLEASEDFDPAEWLIAFATAIEGACPRLGLRANLLPEERRQSDSRWLWAPTAALAALLGLLAVGFAVRPVVQDRIYAAELQTRIDRLEAINLEAEQARGRTAEIRRKTAALEALAKRAESDLRILRELSEVTPNSAWLSQLRIDDDGAQLSGTADRSAPLLRLINQAPSLAEASFTSSLRKTDEGEQFRIAVKRDVPEQDAAESGAEAGDAAEQLPVAGDAPDAEEPGAAEGPAEFESAADGTPSDAPADSASDSTAEEAAP